MRHTHAARGSSVLLAVAAVAVGTSLLHAADPADLNLFSGESTVKPEAEPERAAANPVLNFLIKNLASRDNPAAVTKPSTGVMAHTLIFQDGRQLRGELVSLGKDQVVWKRSDANQQLTFSRSEIRFVVLSRDALQQTGQSGMVFQEEPPGMARGAGNPAPATVKLPGNDWLRGSVRSTDGETFELSLGSESKFTVPRSAIEWMQFGVNPAPAIHLTSDRMALAGWLRGGGKAEIQMENGWMTSQANWLGRNISPPQRFETRFDLDAEDSRPTTLWIQPFGPQPNCYGTGTVVLEFAKGELGRCIYINNINHEKTPMPKDAGPNGRASYRVYYDGIDGKVTVTRNGQSVGDWKLREEKEVNGQAQQVRGSWQRNINGICLQRDQGMRLGSFSVQPWDGTIPKAGDPERTQDSLTAGKEAPILGKLESIGDKELVFAGQKKVTANGTFLQLHSQPKPMAGADVSLMFGTSGELGAGEFEIQNGRAKFQTSFAGMVDVPVSTLQVIRLSPAEQEPVASSALVFKNGDELPGSLARAASGEPLHWKTPGGQEVEFQPERISGVRFLPKEERKESTGARVELRNGDQLRGTVGAFGKDGLQLKHEQLGALKITTDRLWTLFPDPKTTVFDAANDPESWLPADGVSRRPGRVAQKTKRPDCVNLNGFFLMRPPGGGLETNESSMGMARDLKGLPDKFELRCEALEPMGQEPNISLRFSTVNEKGNTSTLDLEFYYGNLRIYGWMNNGNGRSFWKDVALREQNGRFQPEPRVAIRLFVDNKLGTIDVYSQGIHRVKSGVAANERIPGIGSAVTINGSSSTGTPLVISNVWAGPWNGQLPEPGEGPAVALANGDVAEVAPTGLRDGKLLIESSGAELEVPLDRVQAVGFGGKPDPAASAGRLRLVSGDSVAVDKFQFADGQIIAHSPVLGDLKLASDSLRELVLDAAPPHFPIVTEKKKKKATAANDERAGAPNVLPAEQ